LCDLNNNWFSGVHLGRINTPNRDLLCLDSQA
jgi:hypothetical protein